MNITASALDLALAWIRQAEGGESDHPHDRGGRTAYGISQAHPEAWADGRVTWEEAREIYVHDYWRARGIDRLPSALAIAVFDGEVQHRPRTAIRLAQRALGVVPDGIIGPVTEAAAREADAATVIDRYLALRARHYHDIVLADSRQAVFLEGWYWRLFRLHRYLMEVLPHGGLR